MFSLKNRTKNVFNFLKKGEDKSSHGLCLSDRGTTTLSTYSTWPSDVFPGFQPTYPSYDEPSRLRQSMYGTCGKWFGVFCTFSRHE